MNLTEQSQLTDAEVLVKTTANSCYEGSMNIIYKMNGKQHLYNA